MSNQIKTIFSSMAVVVFGCFASGCFTAAVLQHGPSRATSIQDVPAVYAGDNGDVGILVLYNDASRYDDPKRVRLYRLILDDLESQIKYALTEKQRLDTEGPAVVKRAFVLAPFLESGDLRPVDPDQEEANRSDIERMIGSGRWIGDAYEYTDCCGHRLRWEMQHAEQVVEFDITLSAGSVGTGLALWRYPLIPFAVVGDLILSPIYVLGGIVFIFAMQ